MTSRASLSAYGRSNSSPHTLLETAGFFVSYVPNKKDGIGIRTRNTFTTEQVGVVNDVSRDGILIL